MKDKCNEFWILLAGEFFLFLALLSGCFRREEMVYSYVGGDIAKSAGMAESCGEFYGARTELVWGVYQVRIWTRLEDGQSMYVKVNYDKACFRSLNNNGMNILPGDDYEDFQVYVSGKVPSAYIQCSFNGTDADALVRIEVWKTNKGCRILLVIVLAFFAALDFLILFRRRVLEGKVTGRQQVVFWTLTAGVLIACFPYLTDYFSYGADTYYHVERIAFLADALEQGVHFPVRMQGTWLYGHGYATSLFYGDLFLYIPAFLCLTGFPVMSAYKIFIFLVTAATAVIAYFSFRRCVKEEYGALFGSMVHLLAAYRIFNVYSRGAMGEYLAAVFLPLVCCGMYLLYTGDTASKEYGKYKWYVVWGMSGLLQSHLLSAEMTAIFMAVVCAVFWRRSLRKRTLCQLLAATGIVLLINMWFWLLMIYMLSQDVYYVHSLTAGGIQDKGILFAGIFQLLPRKGEGNIGVYRDEPVQIGIGGLLLLLYYALWWYWKKKQYRRNVCSVLALFIAAALFMSTRYFPWDAIIKLPVIGFFVGSLQFPSRLLAIACVLAAMFTAFFFQRVKEQGGMAAKTVVGIAALIMIGSAVHHVGSIAFDAAPVWLYNIENMGTIGIINGEWLLEETDLSEMYYHKPVAEEGLAWSEYEKRGTNVSLRLENESGEVHYIEIPLTGYKGYGIKASDCGMGYPVISEQRGAHGDLRVRVPAGYRGTVEIFYEGFVLFHVAEVLSLLGLAVILGYAFIGVSGLPGFIKWKRVRYEDKSTEK